MADKESHGDDTPSIIITAEKTSDYDTDVVTQSVRCNNNPSDMGKTTDSSIQIETDDSGEYQEFLLCDSECDDGGSNESNMNSDPLGATQPSLSCNNDDTVENSSSLPKPVGRENFLITAQAQWDALKSFSEASIRTYQSQTSSSDICRICHCESDAEIGPLITPCFCRGSLRFVHQDCLQQWIKSSNSKDCELCGYHFVMESKIKPFHQWKKLSMSTLERRKLLCTVLFHIIAITCVTWSLYVLIEKTAGEIQAGDLQWPFWTKLIVVGIGFIGGLVFMYIQCKVYVQLWKRLRAFNRVIYIKSHSAASSTPGDSGGATPLPEDNLGEMNQPSATNAA